jgi:radical SAM superfamily enzyme YgiQ (UPF0313 family)
MKIALIAMSGVRAHNPKLIEVGLTLPGFVERSKVIASLPSLSLLTIAGLTPDDVEVTYHEVADIDALGELPPCDLAAVSTFTAQAKEAYKLAERYRAIGVPTVIGGLHANAVPNDCATHFDAVVTGEGELTWPALVEDFRAGRLAKVYSPEGRTFDLADAPMPRFDLLEVERYNRITVQTQRGCPWRCDFCAASIRIAPKYKVKPVAKVIAEIREIKRIWRKPFIEFADDNSFVNKAHSKELMRALVPERIRWFTESDIAVADDDELLTLMRQAGCAQILIGLESPNAAALDGVEQQRNFKRQRVDRYKEAIARIQSHGISVNGCFVLGLDGDTTAIFEDVFRFVEESGLTEVQITVMTAFPGTPLYTRLRGEGRLIEPEAWEKCTLFDVNVTPKQMSVTQLEAGLVDLAKRLYTEERKKARAAAFREQHRRYLRSRRTERAA